MLGLNNFWTEVDEKIELGNPRLKKRKKQVEKHQTHKSKVSVPGVYVEIATYRKDFGCEPKEKGHEVYDVEDPATGETISAAFIPKMRPGYFDGEVNVSQKVQKRETMDDDATAIRPGQVDQSFSLHSKKFTKGAPRALPDAQIFSEAIRPAPAPSPEEGLLPACVCVCGY